METILFYFHFPVLSVQLTASIIAVLIFNWSFKCNENTLFSLTVVHYVFNLVRYVYNFPK